MSLMVAARIGLAVACDRSKAASVGEAGRVVQLRLVVGNRGRQ